MYTFLFAVAFLGLAAAAAQTDVPRATVNMSSNAEQSSSEQPFQATCEYTVHKPSGHSSDSDWELTVAFHKVVMSSDPYPVLAEYRQSGPNNMTFHTVKIIEGLNVWPADGVTTGLESPKRVYVMPGHNSMFTGGQWKCSVTMKLKGTDAKVRYESKPYMVSHGSSQ